MSTETTLETPCKQVEGESPGTTLTASAAEQQPRDAKERRLTGYHGNRNSMRHGLKASKLPRGCSWIHRDIRGFRRAVEDAVVQTHGEVSIVHAATINTACRAETHAMLAARWLRDQVDSLDANQRLSYSAAVVKASESRDKALASLGLDRSATASFDREYERALQASFSPPTETPATPQQEAQ